MKKKIVLAAMLCLSIMLSGCGSALKKENSAQTEEITASESKRLKDNFNQNIEEQSIEEQLNEESSNEEQINIEQSTEKQSAVLVNKTDSQSEASSENNNGDKIKLAFTGDIYFSDNLYGYYQESGLLGFISPRIIDAMQGADLYIPDHEFVASDGGQVVDYQWFTFRAPLEREIIWKDMGADVITLANNHTLDYGVSALQDTFNELNNLGIDYVGAGNSLDEAIKPCVKEINGKKIAIFGSTRFVPQGSWYATESNPGLLTSYESTPYFGYICDAIAEAKKECDYVLIYTHFGVEKSNSVAEFQKVIAHGYMDAGADLVVGTHPHVLQGIEFYNGKPIIYSLGNFLFGNYHSDTVVLNVTINEDNTSSVNLIPCSSQNYKTVDVTGDDARRLFDFMQSISFDVTIDDLGNVLPIVN